MKVYETWFSPGRYRIKEEEADRQTEKSVWIDGHRHNKRGDIVNYFETRTAAEIFLLAAAYEEVQKMEQWLESANDLRDAMVKEFSD